MLKIASFMANQSVANFPKPNVTMLQLVGSWSNNVTANVYERVHQHNVRIAARHGYHTIGITNTNRWASHPAYAKIMAIHDQCVNEHAKLMWFLDGDVVLMNPYIPVELIWYYYKHQSNNTLDMLFSCDNFDLNSGVFIVNCLSPTAVKTLEYWEIYSKRTNNWKNVPSGMYEHNAIQWLLQTKWWRQSHPRHKRTDKLIRGLTPEELHTYSVDKLRKRVRSIDNICELTVFPIDYICNAISDDSYLTKGPRWWEEGHFAVHTAGIRYPLQRLPFLTNLLDSAAATAAIPPPVATLQEAAAEYSQHYQDQKSSDPTKGFSYNECRNIERKGKRAFEHEFSERLTAEKRQREEQEDKSTSAVSPR
jgi:hypothetical protein